MLKLSGNLTNRPILSLRSGGAIGTSTKPLINPDNLKIEGLYCQDNENKKQMILLYQDIRDMINKGVVVNDHDALSDPEDLVRIKDVIALNFELLGKPVVTNGKQKLGRVVDYAVETESMFIQKLYVEQPIFKSLSGGSLAIDRDQIVEITRSAVVVQDSLQKTKSGSTAPATAPAN